MHIQELAHEGGHTINQYEYDDETVVAVDFGPASGSAEVVGDTVIVIVDDDQYDIDLPAQTTAAGAFMKNGVLTVELEEDR